MSLRRTVTTVAAAGTTIAGLALAGSAVATAKPSGKPAATDHPGRACGQAAVQTLTTTLSGDPQEMILAVTLNHDVGRVVAVVGNADGVLEYGPLAPVSGTPGSYTGVFVPPSGTPVANGDKVLVIGCENHWLTTATVGTDWTPGPGRHQGGPGEPTNKPGGSTGASGPTSGSTGTDSPAPATAP